MAAMKQNEEHMVRPKPRFGVNKEDTAMKKIFAIFLMVATLVACTDVNQLESIEEQDGPKTYTLTIKATKGESNTTKALSIDESGAKNVLNATWGSNDEVTVYNSRTKLSNGTLKAKTPGSANTTLSGSLAGEIQEGDILYLLFPNTTASFEGQDGTLSKIATNYDYCYGKAKVTAVNGTNISAVDFTTESAPVNFTNCQAIVRFTLLDNANNTPINATSFTISAQKTIAPSTTVNTLIKSLDLTASTPVPVTGDLIVTPAATNEFYVALCILSEYNSLSIGGSDITLTADDGTNTYTFDKADVTFTNGQYYEITVKMTVSHEAVDLGLPSGTLWATCNIGASNPEDYGSYFAWGETTTKSEFSWSTYNYCNGDVYSLTKYCQNSSCGYEGFTDTLTILKDPDDAAFINWGGDWRIPTQAQWEELINNTYREPVSGGYRFTSLVYGYTDKSIFLPYSVAQGYDYVSANHGYYWSSSLYTVDPDYPTYANSIEFPAPSGFSNLTANARYQGLSIRPVRIKATE